MLSDVIHEITHELTVPKLVVGLLAYGIIHGTYRILTHIEKAVIHETTAIIKHRLSKEGPGYQDQL